MAMPDYLHNPLYRKVFFEDIGRLLESFRKSIVRLKSNAGNQGALTDLHHAAHSLKGTTLVMELSEISAAAEKMEAELKAKLKAQEYDLSAGALQGIEADIQKIIGLLEALRTD